MVELNPQVNSGQNREDLLQQLFERMFSLMRQIHREIHQDIHHRGPLLSPPQARLIFTLARYKDEGLSVKDLARMVNMTPGAITQFVDVLIEKDLVRREEDLNDRRMVRLKLTSSASSQMEQFRRRFINSAARKFDVLSIDELVQLNNLLAKVSSGSSIRDNEGCL